MARYGPEDRVMPEPITFMGALKAFFEAVHSIWRNGALLLWSCAAAAGVAFCVLYFADRWNVGGAHELSSEYGVYLLLAAAVLGVFAIFKTYSERRARPLILIANERQCMWGQAKQKSGEVITAISLNFQATNVSDGVIQISAVRLRWPRVSRRAIRDTMFLVESPAPKDPTYSRRSPILAHTLKNVSVHFTIGHPIGRPGQTMRVVTIKVQDHARNWYWLTFRDVKSGPVVPESAAPITTATS
jgi:hypothetical protein